ncbi:pentatricopeptide repeat-containing protein At1g08070, chloroplastic-like [Nymphaea colorata]|nr:pentatricopeptide repeat-containing protein At1g08070, chloroplastic-like [Nymphaea colorata]
MNTLSGSLLSLLRNCSTINQIAQIHAQLVVHGFPLHNHFIEKLAEFRCMDYARAIFDRLPVANDFSWNTMIKNYAVNGPPENAILLYCEMLENSIKPSNFTFPMMLKACSHILAIEEGKQIHAHILELGFDSDLYVGNCLIGFYASFHYIDDAKQVFGEMPERDLVTWNTIISGYVSVGEVKIAHQLFNEIPMLRNVISWTALMSGYGQAGRPAEMVHLFVQMLISSDKVIPNSATMVCLVSACSDLCNYELGKWICAFIDVNIVPLDITLSTALLGLYAKRGMIHKARKMFDSLPGKNLVCWNAMINCYMQSMMPNEAIQLFDQMYEEGMKPNEITMVSLLSACAVLGALDLGKWLHLYINRSGLNLNVILGTALVDMYFKCGCVDNACHVFVKMPSKDAATWNSMISGLAIHGNSKDALTIFSQMKTVGWLPNDITFVGVLCACNHCGLVQEGLAHFTSMFKKYNITPKVEHYACLIDLLGRAGHVYEVIALVQSMPFEPDAVIWGSVLSACRIHNDVELADRIGQIVVTPVSSNHGSCILLSNIYAAAGWWKDVSVVRRQMKQIGLRKPAGSSWVEVDHTIHRFLADNVTHPKSVEIFELLERLMVHIKNEGYVSSFDLELQNQEGS